MTARRLVILPLLIATVLAAAFLAYRQFIVPRELQKFLLGEVVTRPGQLPAFNQHGRLVPWNQTWDYSLDEGVPALLRQRYRCTGTGRAVICQKCLPPHYPNMCILKETSLPEDRYRIARILDGKFRVERGQY
jgi:hypothetical protein